MREDNVSNLHLRFQEEGFQEFLQDVIRSGDLEGAALGVAKLALVQGVDALSEKQYFIFEKYVIDAHAVEACKRCGNEIPWHEMIYAHIDGGYCSWCMRMHESMMRE